MIELVDSPDPGARIKVIGAGGCGGNAVSHMIKQGLHGVDFIAVNTDSQALANSTAPMRMQIGSVLTRGRGTGGNPEIGRKAALEDEERLREVLKEAEMVFVTAGMGGGTGTGSAPILARIARESGALTVGVVTKPFQFEGSRRMSQADEGLRELKDAVDTLITIPNQRLLSIASRTTSLREAFQKADDVLLQAVRGISELVTVHGLINLDFADVRSIMAEMGLAMMGAASSTGENRAVEAAQRAISSPLLEDVSIKGARGLLINVTGGTDMSLYEVTEAASLIQEEAHEDANIIFGAVIDERLADEIRITVIATGFGDLATRYSPRYSSSGAPITAPIQAAATRPVDPATVHPTAPTLPPPPPQQRMFRQQAGAPDGDDRRRRPRHSGVQTARRGSSRHDGAIRTQRARRAGRQARYPDLSAQALWSRGGEGEERETQASDAATPSRLAMGVLRDGTSARKGARIRRSSLVSGRTRCALQYQLISARPSSSSDRAVRSGSMMKNRRRRHTRRKPRPIDNCRNDRSRDPPAAGPPERLSPSWCRAFPASRPGPGRRTTPPPPPARARPLRRTRAPIVSAKTNSHP